MPPSTPAGYSGTGYSGTGYSGTGYSGTGYSGTGYSGTPLVKKLGIKPHTRACFPGAPDDYRDLLGDLPPGVEVVPALEPLLDFIHVFVWERAALAAAFPALKAALAFDGALWVSWVKKSAKIPTDVTEDVIREIALPGGLVDVKVCAVDACWSALKRVYRTADRPR